MYTQIDPRQLPRVVRDILTPQTPAITPSRRGFLQVMALGGAGFAIGCTEASPEAARLGGDLFNDYVRIGTDNTVTVLIKHLEMGQGSTTGLAMIVAEELGAAWNMMKYEFAPANATKYANTLMGVQGTGGSTAIANSWMQLRQAGAGARAMLVQAAAKEWGVPAGEITVSEGRVTHPSGKVASFGDLAEAAAKIAPPKVESLKLKDPKDFTIIGTKQHRLDSHQKTNGTMTFTQDIQRPDMVVAVVAHAPKFGATVAYYDDTEARKVAGVVDVIQVPKGVAVVAKNTWAALKGREALKVTWDESKAEVRSTVALLAEYRALAEKPGTNVRKEGDVDAAFKNAAKTLKTTFTFPYLAHATMEPMNAVVEFKPGQGAEIWSGHQIQTVDQMTAAAVLGLRPEQVRINTLVAGGSFGRRGVPDSDYVSEACSIAKAMGGKHPVKLVWTREDDMMAGKYRPIALHQVEGALDAEGNIIGWRQRIVAQSLLRGTPFEAMMQGPVDPSTTEGAADMVYTIPNMAFDAHEPTLGVPVLWWRSVGHTHTAYAVEAFLDQLAREAGKDPLELRRTLLAKDPRRLAVLNLAAEKAGWGTPLPAGRGRGIAVHKSFGTYVAQVAEVSMQDGQVKVERVVCAVDCGIAINPDQVAAQMEGGIGFGLGAILHGKITMTDGTVDQTNFDGYRVLRFSEMPKVEVHIVPSAEPPTGAGEPGTPPIGPAVANAVLALTGRMMTDLPFSDSVQA